MILISGCITARASIQSSNGLNEFCAAAISTYHLEALQGWEQIASTAYDYFEQEGNRVITIEELARVFIETLRNYFILYHI